MDVRTLLDYISKEAGEIKNDIRYEIQGLKDAMKREHEIHGEKITDLKEETERDLALMDERIDDLSKFKWQAMGIVAFVAFAIEMAIQFYRG